MHRGKLRYAGGWRASKPAGRRLPNALVRRAWSRRIIRRFPPNVYVRRLVEAALDLGVTFEPSPLPAQWMYHPGRRAILVWGPDLRGQSLSYLVVIMAHELGHALDFDRRPGLARALLGGSAASPQLDDQVEQAAFVHGFLLLKRLRIPVSLSQYVQMIEPPMAARVEAALSRRLCCLLDRYGPAYVRAATATPCPPTALPPVA